MLLRLCLVWLGVSSMARANSVPRMSDSLTLKVGVLNYKTEGFERSSGTQPGLYSIEFAHYWHKDLSSFFAYRSANRADVQRTFYQASVAGFRYYPYTPGIPMGGRLEYNTISFDALFKPYVEFGGSLGRYLIRVAGNPPVFDASSQFFGVLLGIGSHVQIYQSLAIDIQMAIERNNGFGSPLLFNATSAFGLAGVVWYF